MPSKTRIIMDTSNQLLSTFSAYADCANGRDVVAKDDYDDLTSSVDEILENFVKKLEDS